MIDTVESSDFQTQSITSNIHDNSKVVHPKLAEKVKYFHTLIENIRGTKGVDQTTEGLTELLIKNVIDIEISQIANEFIKPYVKTQTFIPTRDNANAEPMVMVETQTK